MGTIVADISTVQGILKNARVQKGNRPETVREGQRSNSNPAFEMRYFCCPTNLRKWLSVPHHAWWCRDTWEGVTNPLMFLFLLLVIIRNLLESRKTRYTFILI